MVITRYNESLVDPRAVNLTNSIGTVDIEVPVGFSYPTGSFRLSEPNNIEFTHFSASIPSAGGTRFFKITNLTCINSKVTEYYYDIDYLKDYWMRFSGGSPTLSLKNTLISSYYREDNETLQHTVFPVNQYLSSVAQSVNHYEGTELLDSNICIVVNSSGTTSTIPPHGQAPGTICRAFARNSDGNVVCNKQVYFLDNCTLLDVINAAILKGDAEAAADTPSAHTNYTAVFSNISHAFYVPMTPPSTERHDTNGFMYFIDKDGRTKSTNFGDTEGALVGHLSYLTTSGGSCLYDADIYSQISFTLSNANQLPPYYDFNIYVPYVGWYHLPLSEIFTNSMFGIQQFLWLRMTYDLLNGKVACRFGLSSSNEAAPSNFSAYQTPFVPLPSAPILTSNYAANITTAQNQYASAMQSNAITSLMGLGAVVAPALTGNIPLAAAGLAGVIGGSLTRQFNADAAKEQANKNNGIGGFTSSKDSDLGQTERRVLLTITRYKTSLTVTKASELYGFPINEYTDTIDLTNSTGVTKPNRAWLDVSNSTFIGPEWYVNKVKTEYNRDYITYVNVS